MGTWARGCAVCVEGSNGAVCPSVGGAVWGNAMLHEGRLSSPPEVERACSVG